MKESRWQKGRAGGSNKRQYPYPVTAVETDLIKPSTDPLKLLATTDWPPCIGMPNATQTNVMTCGKQKPVDVVARDNYAP